MTEASHPLGLIDNPEWAASRYRREELYLEERARRYAKPRRRFGPVHFAIALTVLMVAAAVIGAG